MKKSLKIISSLFLISGAVALTTPFLVSCSKEPTSQTLGPTQEIDWNEYNGRFWAIQWVNNSSWPVMSSVQIDFCYQDYLPEERVNKWSKVYQVWSCQIFVVLPREGDINVHYFEENYKLVENQYNSWVNASYKFVDFIDLTKNLTYML